MAHFLGTLQGARGEASRLGGKESGLRTVAASWQGSVRVYLSVENGVDWATVLLYEGPISGEGAKEFKAKRR